MGKKVTLQFRFMTTVKKDIELPEGKSIEDMVVTSSGTMIPKITHSVVVIPEEDNGDLDTTNMMEMDTTDFDVMDYTSIGYSLLDYENEKRTEHNWYELSEFIENDDKRVVKDICDHDERYLGALIDPRKDIRNKMKKAYGIGIVIH